MSKQPDFEISRAHQYFATSCFNAAWELIDRSARTSEDDERMIRLSHASLWHRTQREDCTNRNLSIGYWQLARIYALLKQPENARRYGQLCLQVTPPDDPFCLGYAYEALARAETLSGNREEANTHLSAARQQAALVEDLQDRELLLKDLAELEG